MLQKRAKQVMYIWHRVCWHGHYLRFCSPMLQERPKRVMYIRHSVCRHAGAYDQTA